MITKPAANGSVLARGGATLPVIVVPTATSIHRMVGTDKTY